MQHMVLMQNKGPSISISHEINSLWDRGRKFLGSRFPLMGGAMSWVSERNLVSSISEAGGFGVIACGSMGVNELAEEIDATFQMTNKPFGVNLIIMHPDLDRLVDVCLSKEVGHIVLAGGMPSRSLIDKIRNKDTKVISFAPTLPVGKKLVRQGVDALIIEGMEAGGHIGPVSTSVLAQEILPNIKDVPIFVGGGIGHGEMIASLLSMGASGCQIGTRFVCASESIAHPNFKKAFIRASARDSQVTVQVDPDFPVIPVRAIHNAGSQEFIMVQKDSIKKFRSGEISQKEAQLEIEHFWAGALRKAVIDGDTESGSLMAGQSVGMVKCEQPVDEIIKELIVQAESILKR
mgnify:FL=1